MNWSSATLHLGIKVFVFILDFFIHTIHPCRARMHACIHASTLGDIDNGSSSDAIKNRISHSI